MFKCVSSVRAYCASFTSDSVTLSLIYFFMHKLLMLLKANIPIIQCLELIERSEQSIPMKKLLYLTKKELRAGKRVSDSFLSFADYVEPFFYRLLRVGEETGQLEWTLQQLVDYLDAKVSLQKKIRQALFYPAVILSVSLLLFLSLFIFIIPEFAALFKESAIVLPFYTQALFTLACFFKVHLFLIVCVFGIMAFLLTRLPLFASLQSMLSILFSRTQFIKSYRDKRYLAEFCQQMATCLAAGLPMVETLFLIQPHGCYEEYRMVTSLIRGIKSGYALGVSMEGEAGFPVFMVEMIKVGEASGTLERVFLYLAQHYQGELDQFLMAVRTLIEPLIICMLGALIGCLVISIYLPIFKLGSVWQ